MPIKRRDIGLHVITNGRPTGMPWNKFVSQVVEAAAQPKRTCNVPGNPTSTSLYKKPTPERQCDFVSSKTGKRCGNWSMKGAKRCHKHGGYRQNPQHPATVRRLDDILHTREDLRAAQVVYHSDPKTRAIIEKAVKGEALPLNPQTVEQGIVAYEQDDNGRAYRRWLKQIQASRPSAELRARKTQLKQKRQEQQNRKM